MASENKLNPQVRTVTIGVRTLRKIKVYPLSLKDQLDLSDLIVESLQKYNEIVADTKKPDIQVLSEVAEFVINLINENIDSLIDKVTDREEDVNLLEQITNDQAFEIGQIIYEVNFSKLLKNVKSLFGEEPMPEQLLKRQSQRSAKSTATNSKTSSIKATKKAG